MVILSGPNFQFLCEILEQLEQSEQGEQLQQLEQLEQIRTIITNQACTKNWKKSNKSLSINNKKITSLSVKKFEIHKYIFILIINLVR